MDKIAIGIWIRLHRMDRRLWFEVPNNDQEKEKFDRVCACIDVIPDASDWKQFVASVELLFMEQGFYRIAK